MLNKGLILTSQSMEFRLEGICIIDPVTSFPLGMQAIQAHFQGFDIGFAFYEGDGANTSIPEWIPINAKITINQKTFIVQYLKDYGYNGFLLHITDLPAAGQYPYKIVLPQ